MDKVMNIDSNPRYTIKAVSERTGILPVTIRAWERRHKILSPQRSNNRYRMYTEKDIAILHWIKNRIDQGLSISIAVAELQTLQKNGFIPEEKLDYQMASPKPTGIAPSEYSVRLYKAFLESSELKAGEIFGEARAAFDLQILLTKVVIPTLVKIGDAWYRGDIRVTTEHFASKFILGKLMNIFQSMPLRSKKAYIIMGCAPDEFHEIGSLMLAILLRNQGYRIDYLGADIPLDDLIDFVQEERPNLVILSATMPDAAEYVIKAGTKINNLPRPSLFGYGGPLFVNQPKLRSQVMGSYLGDSLDDAVKTTNTLLNTK